jgi:hypothetical protein
MNQSKETNQNHTECEISSNYSDVSRPYWYAIKHIYDLGGEPGGPIRKTEREVMRWESNTYATCECLSWRGIWTNVEKLRRAADLGDIYLKVPYSARWLLAAACALVDKGYITQTELLEKIDEIRRGYAEKPL